jgi:glycosyltransferase involved in cell wall biosynthesis
VHLVAPWDPAIRRPAEEDGVQFHFFKYAPVRALNVFGYSGGLRADTTLRGAAWMAAPFAMAAGWWAANRVARKHRATVMHAHWVIPSGVLAAGAKPSLPLVVSLHGSDVFVAERNWIAKQAARAAFRRAGWMTACSDDLRNRAVAIGAPSDRIETVPYGVDAARFHPDPEARRAIRQELGIGEAPLVVSAGRLVKKKGFEYLMDAAHLLRDVSGLTVAIAGDGDLRDELTARAALSAGHVRLIGNRSQDDIARPLCGSGCDRRSVDSRRLGECRWPAQLRARSARLRHARRVVTRRRSGRRPSTTAERAVSSLSATRLGWRPRSVRCSNTRTTAGGWARRHAMR